MPQLTSHDHAQACIRLLVTFISRVTHRIRWSALSRAPWLALTLFLTAMARTALAPSTPLSFSPLVSPAGKGIGAS